MTDTAHTPGPWNLVWWGNEEYPYPLSVLADRNSAWVARGGSVSSEANARLIAAAPDLLDELQNIANASPHTWDDPSDFQGWAQSRARAAIAKAKGEAP